MSSYNPYKHLEVLWAKPNPKNNIETNSINEFKYSNLLYWPFKPKDYNKNIKNSNLNFPKWIPQFQETGKENIDIKFLIKNLENSKKVKENTLFPIFKALHNSKKISTETYHSILSQLYNNPDEITNFINKLENPEEKSEIIKNIDSKEKNNLNNFKEIIEQFDNIDWLDKLKNTKRWEIYNDIYNIIWENFYKIYEWWENPEEKNIVLAIEISWNKILKKFPSIKKYSDYEMYKNAFKDINSWNIERWIKWLKNLYLLWSTYAFAWKKLDEKQIKRLNKEFENRKIEIQKEIEDLQNKLTIEKNKKEKTQIQEQIISLKKEINEIESWDIFTGNKKLEINEELSQKE